MSKTFNILMLGGAKRVAIANLIKAAGTELGLEVRIFSYELSLEVPIASVGTVVPGRRWSSPDILEHLHQVATTYGIRVMLPFVDAAVGVVADYLATYPGEVFAPVVESSLAETLFDKIASETLFVKAGIAIPETYNGKRPRFPLIAKPSHGSASKGIVVIKDIADFRRISGEAGKYLIQKYIADREEYTVDCYVRSDGEILCVSPRKRLEVSGGEVMSTVTVDIPELTRLSTECLTRLGLKGAVTLQFIHDLAEGRYLLMEINPRLGGGVVCSVHADAPIPAYILEEGLGRKPEARGVPKGGVLITRYMQEVVFK